MAINKFVCPFCFEESNLSDIKYRCTNKQCKAHDESDEALKEYWGDMRTGHVMSGKGGLASMFGRGKAPVCDVCHHVTTRICPNCHNTLPPSTVEGKDNIISVVGTRSSGKSHYIGVLVKELEDRVAPAFNASMMGFIDPAGTYNANEIYRETKGDALYKEMKTLDLTNRDLGKRAAGDKDKVPLIYTWNYTQKQKGLPKAFTLAFMDAAGEDLQDITAVETVNRYIANSKGIILLVDPLQIDEVRERLDEEGVDYTNSTGGVDPHPAREVLANVTSMIKEARHIAIDKEIDIPVAIAFSKFDAIQPITKHARNLQRPTGSPHAAEGLFVDSDCASVDAEIRSLLEEWGESALVTQIESNYERASFFAVSSLGLHNEPSAREEEGVGKHRTAVQRIKKPHPLRVEDPLLWIMAEDGLVQRG